MTWLPISTAPKDETNVILAIGETIPDVLDVRVGSYLTTAQALELGAPGRGWLVWNDCCDWFYVEMPWFWMPLPATPDART